MLRFACLALLVAAVASLELSAKLENHWEKFKSAHKKSYSPEEEQAKKEIFKKNVEQILQHNLDHDLGDHSHTLGINEFSDMTHEEFKSKFLGLSVPTNATVQPAPPSAGLTAPASADWRSYLTPIKNQGSCGSCWTFSVTGALEGHVAIYTGQRIALSEQNLLDCASRWGNQGCNGGFPDYAFQYIIDQGGVDQAYCYPYTGREGQCRYQPNCVGARMSGFVNVPRSEGALMEAVATKGPVAVGMDAGQTDLQQYSGGIYDSPRCSNTALNHAVVVVGYGTENGRSYWLIRNSWGTSWGIQGYFKVARNGNRCGIINTASYPTL